MILEAFIVIIVLFVGIMVGVVSRDAINVFRHTDGSGNRFYLGALVTSVLLNSLIGGLLWTTRSSAQDYFTCIADWQTEWQEAYLPRQDASVSVQSALDEIVRAVDSQNRDALRKAVTDYVKLREQQDTERSKNPYPEPPDQACGTPQEVRR